MKEITQVMLLGMFIVVASCSPFAATSGTQPLFSGNDRLLIARSIAEGRSRICIIFAVEPSSTTSVAIALRSLGGTVRYEADELGYLRADVPLDRIGELSSIPNVDLADVSPPNQFDVELEDAKIRLVASKTIASNAPDGLPTPSASTPNLNDFTGIGEVGAAQFIASHPTYDGRGVRIAFLEPIAPNISYLQMARDLQGRVVPKLIEHHFTTDLSDLDARDRLLNGWVAMRSVVHVTHSTFVYAGRRYTAPRDGTYSFGICDISKTYYGKYEPYHNVLHPHGTAYGTPTQFGVLWDERRNLVWVDTNQDGNFAKQHALTDYAVHHDYGILRLRSDSWNDTSFSVFANPNEAPDDYPFVVQTDREHAEVGIFIDMDDHAIMVASSAAGSDFFNGAFNGMAPGAQLLSFDQAVDYPYFLESMIVAAREHVDIISGQFVVDFRFDDGHDVWDKIVHRIIEHYGVVILSGAGNDGPTMTTVDTPATADSAFAVGGYVRGERIELLRGGAVSGTDYIADYSSRGPRGDGAAKPDFLAPTEWLAGTSPLAPPGILRGRIALPPGYAVGDGTSQATPSAAGPIALLISAAKQAHVPYSAERLWLALVASTRVLPGYQAYEQGAGLIDVPRAWEKLRHLARAEPEVSGDAPVRTAVSASIGNRGPGLYEREGWPVGMRAQRIIGLTRTSGDAGSQSFNVRWIQSDGTFTSTETVTLPLNVRTDFIVDVHPRTVGVHSAFLELVDHGSGNVVYRQLETVVAAEQFAPANGFSLCHRGVVAHPGIVHYFFNVPPHTDLLSISLVIDHADTPEFFRAWTGELVDVHMPDGRKPALETLLQPYHDGDRYARAYAKPMPGVWEVAINNETPGFRYAHLSRTPLPPTRFTFSAQVLGVHIIRSLRIARNIYRVELINTEAALHPRKGTANLGSMQRSAVTLSSSQPYAVLPIAVPREASEVRVEAAALVPLGGTDATIYLFNCAKNVPATKVSWVYQGPCELKATGSLSTGGVATTALPSGGDGQLLNLEPTPVPGRWIAVIAATSPLSGPLSLQVTRVVASLRYGNVTTESHFTRVPSGDRWSVTVTITPSASLRTEADAVPLLSADEGDTIWEGLPATENGSVLLNTKPTINHSYTPIWLDGFSR